MAKRMEVYMREIKFRAWDMEDKKMLDFSLRGMIDGSGEFLIAFDGNLWKKEKKILTVDDIQKGLDIFISHRKYKDKNNKDSVVTDIQTIYS